MTAGDVIVQNLCEEDFAGFLLIASELGRILAFYERYVVLSSTGNSATGKN